MKLSAPPLDDAVLLRDDLVEELNRVRWMAPQRVVHAKLDDLLAIRGRQQQPGHRVARLPSEQRDDKPTSRFDSVGSPCRGTFWRSIRAQRGQRRS